MSTCLDEIKDAVVRGDYKNIEAIVKKALADTVNPEDILKHSLISAMDEVGKRFAASQIYIPEMLVAAQTMKKGIDRIKPFLKTEVIGTRGTILMGTVKGDLHDIGKNIVIMMLEGAGFKVIDLGVDLAVEKIVRQVEEIKPEVLGLSSLLTTTMPEMEKVIHELETKGLRNSVKVIVGGAPLNMKFAEQIGADGYGKDATAAVNLSRKLVGVR